MAVDGKITVKPLSSYNLFVDFNWSRTNISYANNTSTIAWEIVFRDEALLNVFDADTYIATLTIDGVTTLESLIYSPGIGAKVTKTVASGTRVITHNADGTKNLTVNCSIAYGGYNMETIVLSDTFELDPITPASNVTCSIVNIGTAPTITIHRNNSNFKHTLIYRWYGEGSVELSRGFIAQDTTEAVIDDFVWPMSFYENIPNSAVGKGYIQCNTYNNGYLVDTPTYTLFKVKANEYATPTFKDGYPIIKDTNAITKTLTGDENKLIRYASTAYVDVGAEAQNYATIARQRVENNNWYFETSTGSFGNVESGKFSFELEDSRGFISKPVRDIQDRFIEYFLPTCNMANDKPNANGTMTLTCSGIWFNESFGAARNNLTAQYRWKKSTDEWQSAKDDWNSSEWKTMTVSAGSDNTYNASATFTMWDPDTEEGEEAHRLTYDFQVRVTDLLFSAFSTDYPAKSASIFDWSKNDFQFNVPVKFNAGIIGGELPSQDLSKYALKDDIPEQLPNPYGLTINGQFYDGTSAVEIDIEDEGTDLSEGGTINGDLRVTGDLRIKGDGNYGNTLYFGDGTYASISEPTDDYLLVKASKITLNGSEVNLTATNIYVNGTSLDDLINAGGGGGGGGSIDAADGTWTPVLSGYAVSSYTTRQGWYQKVGNVVTIGFTIKATCYTGYNAAQITLSGLPYTPKYDASGGGICSGVYISAGFNFECWAVNTSGQISARVQACNNTSAANLATSASGIFYPSGGGEITIGGTICYITN